MRILLSAAVLAGLALVSAPQKAQAGPDPFIGEIMFFGGNFCPRGWAVADGSLLPISQYSALFSLFGTFYGGDGRTTFGLPDLIGRAAVGAGNSSTSGRQVSTGQPLGQTSRAGGTSDSNQLGVMACVALEGIYPSRN